MVRNIIFLIVDSNVKMKKIMERIMTKIYAAIASVGQMEDGTSEMTDFCEELLDSLNEELNRRKQK